MAKFFELLTANLTSAQADRVEALVDNRLHEVWLNLNDQQEFDSTTYPAYTGAPYPDPAAKVALAEWFVEYHFGNVLRGYERDVAEEAITVEPF